MGHGAHTVLHTLLIQNHDLYTFTQQHVHALLQDHNGRLCVGQRLGKTISLGSCSISLGSCSCSISFGSGSISSGSRGGSVGLCR